MENDYLWWLSFLQALEILQNDHKEELDLITNLKIGTIMIVSSKKTTIYSVLLQFLFISRMFAKYQNMHFIISYHLKITIKTFTIK